MAMSVALAGVAGALLASFGAEAETSGWGQAALTCFGLVILGPVFVAALGCSRDWLQKYGAGIPGLQSAFLGAGLVTWAAAADMKAVAITLGLATIGGVAFLVCCAVKRGLP